MRLGAVGQRILGGAVPGLLLLATTSSSCDLYANVALMPEGCWRPRALRAALWR
jgi:hypothetical protein